MSAWLIFSAVAVAALASLAMLAGSVLNALEECEPTVFWVRRAIVWLILTLLATATALDAYPR